MRGQDLFPGDYQTRLDMAQFFVSKSDDWFRNLVVSDEAWFTLNGSVNSKNVVR